MKAKSEKNVLRAGAAKIKITPPVTIPILGHHSRISEGIHDDLWGKVLVLEKGGERAAVVALDLVWPMPEGDYVKIREGVEKATGIEGSRIMVSCTHNHQGPTLVMSKKFPMSLKKQQEIVIPWIEELPRRIGEAAEEAAANMKRVNLFFGKTLITGLCYNRGKSTPDGIASLCNVTPENKYYFGDTPVMARSIREKYINWGMPPEEAERYAPLGIPDGPIDPDLDVITVKDQDGNPIAVLTNFACHAVACSPPIPDLISAGFPGCTADFVEEATGAVCLFTAGAGGDIRPYRSLPEFEEAERIGLVLASGVLKAMRESEAIEDPDLRVLTKMVEVDWRDYPTVPEAKKFVAKKEKLFEKARTEGRFRDAMKLEKEIAPIEFAVDFLEGWIGPKGKVALEIQAISVGDVVLLGIPNEVNVSVGLDIKRSSWTDKLLLCSLTNGCYMYLLKKDEYEGGYESAACRLAPGAGEKIITAASDLIERLKNR
jgi:hypothetical protein